MEVNMVMMVMTFFFSPPELLSSSSRAGAAQMPLGIFGTELELELIPTRMTQRPVLRVGNMRARCAQVKCRALSIRGVAE